jgi:hypothetical protein
MMTTVYGGGIHLCGCGALVSNAHTPHPCPSMLGCAGRVCARMLRVTVTILRGDGHGFFVDTTARGKTTYSLLL